VYQIVAVWIDDDPDPDTDNTSILPHHFCNTSARKEVFKNAAANPDRELTNIHTHSDLSITKYFHKSDLARERLFLLLYQYLYVSLFPELQKSNFRKPSHSPGLKNHNHNRLEIRF